ncbi:hypothetical protein IU427_14230 [Nocardia beijingensis]|uniref:hypothetical protein n=1 Tax=Nocardia beijingensis TaxID=95162 RepID=UPI001894804F|nr:hypothetical protein [Nocardia beijingensis]MBF6466325.1 hypothetical protein [Nocardia beijingensis]
MSGQARRRQRSVTTQGPAHAEIGYGISVPARRRQRSVTTQGPPMPKSDTA